jgi:hypothetical protein
MNSSQFKTWYVVVALFAASAAWAQTAIRIASPAISPIPISSPPDVILCHKPFGGGIYTMKPDGSNKKELSNFGWYGEFNPGGTKIAFSRYYMNGILTMDADGGNKKELTDFGFSPSWSPNGNKIVFTKGDTYAANRRMYVMNADGSGLIQLTSRVADWPNYAHFSNKIVFESFGNGIWVINDDGTGETQISTQGYTPSWSPDDGKIVYQQGTIRVMNPNGSSAHAVSVSSGSLPSMGANGKIAFEATGDRIIVVDTVTKTETVVSTGYLAPDWVTRKTNPLAGTGFIFAGVGFIPFSQITDGYATTDPGYCLYVKNAPFGASLNIFTNFSWLRGLGVAGYLVQVAKWPAAATPPAEADFITVDDSWGNYLWNGATGKFDYYTIAADANKRYKVPGLFEYWYLRDLLHAWNSTRFADGKYTMRIKGYDAASVEVSLAGAGVSNTLTMVVDNTPPSVRLDTLLYAGAPVPACAVVDMGMHDNLNFVITAKDNAGHLRNYSLDAFWGENASIHIADGAYNPAVHGLLWTGISKTTFSYNAWPQTCAYQFRVSATNRTTNGYYYLHYSEYNKHVTLVLH